MFRIIESHWFVWVSQSNHIPMEIDYDKERPWLSLQVGSCINYTHLLLVFYLYRWLHTLCVTWSSNTLTNTWICMTWASNTLTNTWMCVTWASNTLTNTWMCMTWTSNTLTNTWMCVMWATGRQVFLFFLLFPIFSAIPINSYFLRNSYFFLFLWVFRFAARFFAANPQISLRRTCFLSWICISFSI